MTIKRPSRKQVIVPMSKNNMEVILNQANFLINRYLTKANSNIITDFIHLENNRVVITIYQATSAKEISIIKKICQRN